MVFPSFCPCFDPHVWTSPKRARIQVSNLGAGLAAAAPDAASSIKAARKCSNRRSFRMQGGSDDDAAMIARVCAFFEMRIYAIRRAGCITGRSFREWNPVNARF